MPRRFLIVHPSEEIRLLLSQYLEMGWPGADRPAWWKSFQPSSIEKRWQYYQDLERMASPSARMPSARRNVIGWSVGEYLARQRELPVRFLFYERLIGSFQEEWDGLARFLDVPATGLSQAALFEELSHAAMRTEAPDHVRHARRGDGREAEGEGEPEKHQREEPAHEALILTRAVRHVKGVTLLGFVAPRGGRARVRSCSPIRASSSGVWHPRHVNRPSFGGRPPV